MVSISHVSGIASTAHLDLPVSVLRLPSLPDLHMIELETPIKPVASGGHGEVFKGLHPPTQMVCAMKRPYVVTGGTTQSQEEKKGYEREAKMWSCLKHINILPFYGIVELSSGAYLVSPWIEYGDLSRFLAARREFFSGSSNVRADIPERTRSAFAAFNEAVTIHGIASGLAYLHENGVIHGDLKALNVLLDDLLSPLICDFGLTKNHEFNNTTTGSKDAWSTRWRCPSLFEEQSQKTEKTDMYAFGMTIVE
ncbi:hypothetical protein FRB97_003720, partial [Tulasnella sp. 331]